MSAGSENLLFRLQVPTTSGGSIEVLLGAGRFCSAWQLPGPTQVLSHRESRVLCLYRRMPLVGGSASGGERSEGIPTSLCAIERC